MKKETAQTKTIIIRTEYTTYHTSKVLATN
jgi:hypothetical protein